MGGELKVESVPGEGSRFYFALPLVPERDGSCAARDDESGGAAFDARLAPGEELTALVVDDSTANRRILASLLESAGVRVITAAGGLEAMRLTRTHRPEVIFMDLKMSDLDGIEATRRLGRSGDRKHPGHRRDRERVRHTRQTARDAGCVDYLSKPVRAESLFAMLQTHLGVRFVTSDGQTIVHELDFTDSERRRGIASQLRNAVALGDVSDIQALARDLMRAHRGGRRRPAHQPAGERLRLRWLERAGRCSARTRNGRSRQPVSQRAAHGPQILLVDDNPTNLQVLYQTLDGHGYRLLAARSGKDALSIAERAAPGPDHARRDDAGDGRLRDVRPPEGESAHA